MVQVYREIEHPKLRNLEKAEFVIFGYSLIFTAEVAFLQSSQATEFMCMGGNGSQRARTLV